MSALQDIKLVPREAGIANFESGKMTVDFGDDGNPKLIEGLEALDQDVLKAVFTSVQADGYGTVIKQIVGEKNRGVVQAMLTYTIIGSLQVLINIHNGLHKRFPTQFRLQRMLANLEFLRVKKVTVTSVKVLADFRTQATEPRSLEFPIQSKD